MTDVRSALQRSTRPTIVESPILDAGELLNERVPPCRIIGVTYALQRRSSFYIHESALVGSSRLPVFFLNAGPRSMATVFARLLVSLHPDNINRNRKLFLLDLGDYQEIADSASRLVKNSRPGIETCFVLSGKTNHEFKESFKFRDNGDDTTKFQRFFGPYRILPRLDEAVQHLLETSPKTSSSEISNSVRSWWSHLPATVLLATEDSINNDMWNETIQRFLIQWRVWVEWYGFEDERRKLANERNVSFIPALGDDAIVSIKSFCGAVSAILKDAYRSPCRIKNGHFYDFRPGPSDLLALYPRAGENVQYDEESEIPAIQAFLLQRAINAGFPVKRDYNGQLAEYLGKAEIGKKARSYFEGGKHRHPHKRHMEALRELSRYGYQAVKDQPIDP